MTCSDEIVHRGPRAQQATINLGPLGRRPQSQASITRQTTSTRSGAKALSPSTPSPRSFTTVEQQNVPATRRSRGFSYSAPHVIVSSRSPRPCQGTGGACSQTSTATSRSRQHAQMLVRHWSGAEEPGYSPWMIKKFVRARVGTSRRTWSAGTSSRSSARRPDHSGSRPACGTAAIRWQRPLWRGRGHRRLVLMWLAAITASRSYEVRVSSGYDSKSTARSSSQQARVDRHIAASSAANARYRAQIKDQNDTAPSARSSMSPSWSHHIGIVTLSRCRSPSSGTSRSSSATRSTGARLVEIDVSCSAIGERRRSRPSRIRPLPMWT